VSERLKKALARRVVPHMTPALGLHARAQKDFLRYIDEQFAPTRQVIYSTHSPFMVQPGQLDRVRMVEDHGREVGSTISSDVLATDPDTLFPL
jgi:predicted ATP-dependent endonuclease of OLD family